MIVRLPDMGAAVLEIGKLRDYCLNPDHPRGKHKARLFRAALDIGRHDANELRALLVAATAMAPAEALHDDSWGRYWRVDAPVERQGRRVVVRTLWIVRNEETFPRFVTCWVL